MMLENDPRFKNVVRNLLTVQHLLGRDRANQVVRSYNVPTINRLAPLYYEDVVLHCTSIIWLTKVLQARSQRPRVKWTDPDHPGKIRAPRVAHTTEFIGAVDNWFKACENLLRLRAPGLMSE